MKQTRLNRDEKREVALRACSEAGIRVPSEVWIAPGQHHYPMNWDMIRFVYDQIERLSSDE